VNLSGEVLIYFLMLDVLAIQDPPNEGVLKTVGPLGIDLGDDASFDIVTLDSNGLPVNIGLVLDAGRLYRINLSTGQLSFVGLLGGTGPFRGLIVRP
jgi:hypothetical protein